MLCLALASYIGMISEILEEHEETEEIGGKLKIDK
jgi:hypothetical protein